MAACPHSGEIYTHGVYFFFLSIYLSIKNKKTDDSLSNVVYAKSLKWQKLK